MKIHVVTNGILCVICLMLKLKLKLVINSMKVVGMNYAKSPQYSPSSNGVAVNI